MSSKQMTLFFWTLRILFQFLLPSSHCSILPFFHSFVFFYVSSTRRLEPGILLLTPIPSRVSYISLYVDIKNSVFHHLSLVSFLDLKLFQPLWTRVYAVVVVIISHYYFYCQHLISSHRHVFSIVKKNTLCDFIFFVHHTYYITANKFEEDLFLIS